MREPATPESIRQEFDRLADPMQSGRGSPMATHMPASWRRPAATRDSSLLTALGMAVVCMLLVSLALVAAGGWTWFVSFLGGPASSWAQAIGGVLAVVAAFHVGRAQIVADRELDRSRQLDEDLRGIAVIEAGLTYIATAMFLFRVASSESFPHIPAGTTSGLLEGAGLLRRLDPFKCPTAQLAYTVAYIPSICDDFIQAAERYETTSEDISNEEFASIRAAVWAAGNLVIERTEDSRKMCAALRDGLENTQS